MTFDDLTPDDRLHDVFRHAVAGEPAMTERPYDDVRRGRRLLRRRRTGSVLTAAAVVPALALGASVLPDLDSADSRPGKFAAPGPSGGGGQVQGTLSAECVEGTSGARMPRSGGNQATVRLGRGKEANLSGKGSARALSPQGSAVISSEGDCPAVPGEAMHPVVAERLEKALVDGLDPAGDHLRGIIAGEASGPVEATPGDPAPDEGAVSEASLTAEWLVGDQAGGVDLSVSSQSTGPADPADAGVEPCEDPAIVDGPQLSCEQQVLDDGTTVLVGTGAEDGVRRITVRFDRDNGEIIWATADQATQNWWHDGTGAPPLSSPPATVDQLIDLTQDSRVHL